MWFQSDHQYVCYITRTLCLDVYGPALCVCVCVCVLLQGSRGTDRQSAQNCAKSDGRHRGVHGREREGKGYWVSCSPPSSPQKVIKVTNDPPPPQRIPVYRKCKPLSLWRFNFKKEKPQRNASPHPFRLSITHTHTHTHTHSKHTY